MRLVLGVDPDAPGSRGASIRRHLDKIFPVLHWRVNLPFPCWRWFRLPSDHALERALAALKTEVREVIRAARRRMGETPVRRASPGNFLEAVIAASETMEPAFTNDEIYADAVTLLLPGEDTTANTIALAIHYFTGHPEHLARVRAEADEARAAGLRQHPATVIPRDTHAPPTCHATRRWGRAWPPARPDRSRRTGRCRR